MPFAHILSLQGRNTHGGNDTPVHIFPGSPICRYWKVGNCTKAEECQFRHDPEVTQVADEVTRGGNWRLRAARRQEEIDAGNDIDVERVNNKLSALSNLNHQKDAETKNSNPKPFPVRKLLFAVTGKQEIVQEESIVDFSTILRYNKSKLLLNNTFIDQMVGFQW